MFTGIVQGLGDVERVSVLPQLTRFGIRLPEPLLHDLSRGASVSVDGVCLTALEQEGDVVFFEAMGETLQKTTISSIQPGMRVNIERSLRQGAEVGGHMVSGHVDGMAEIMAIDSTENNHVVTFRPPLPLMKYIFAKGFVALDGASLTVVDVDLQEGTFTVWFISETLRVTTFGFKRFGDRVNIEVDAQTRVIVDTLERMNR